MCVRRNVTKPNSVWNIIQEFKFLIRISFKQKLNKKLPKSNKALRVCCILQSLCVNDANKNIRTHLTLANVIVTFGMQFPVTIPVVDVWNTHEHGESMQADGSGRIMCDSHVNEWIYGDFILDSRDWHWNINIYFLKSECWQISFVLFQSNDIHNKLLGLH